MPAIRHGGGERMLGESSLVALWSGAMRRGIYFGGLLVCLSVWAAPVSGQGIFIPSAGPINSAMAGASVAAPIEFGSSYWNPANISGLSSQEFLLGSALLFPDINLRVNDPGGFDSGPVSGDDEIRDVAKQQRRGLEPRHGFSFRLTEDSRLTMGLGVFGLVGGGVNFAGSPTTPILTPHQPPRYFGFGPIFANISMLGINPMAVVPGHGPPGDRRRAGHHNHGSQLRPCVLRSDSRPPRPANFPRGDQLAPLLGAGFQLGLLYEVNEDWNVGFSYKSPIWQQRWEYNASYAD